jgi:hypothetical protein
VSAPERSIPYADALRAELVAAVGRRRHQPLRAPRRLVLTAAAAVLAVAVPFGVALVTGRGGRALAISDQDGTITVRLLDAGADPAKVGRELRDAGVDAEVSSVPVPPGQAGTWVAAVGSPELAGQLERSGAVLRLPAATPGRIELVIGRPARQGERYAVVGGELDATAPELAGLRAGCLLGLDAAVAERQLVHRGLRVAWHFAYSTGPRSGVTEARASVPAGKVSEVGLERAREARVVVSPPQDRLVREAVAARPRGCAR